MPSTLTFIFHQCILFYAFLSLLGQVCGGGGGGGFRSCCVKFKSSDKLLLYLTFMKNDIFTPGENLRSFVSQ